MTVVMKECLKVKVKVITDVVYILDAMGLNICVNMRSKQFLSVPIFRGR